ncbi:MAG: methionyl-tRNA formyltransferase [Burkholderiales bacterium]|nr:methionyl-tRNA formyltransferase [Burkholderiales bacterium]
MNILFAGTPPFAAAALAALLEAGHRISLVLTQPDRPAGRGLKAQASAVKQLALERGLELAQPPSLKDDATVARLAALDADVMVVAAYGLLLPQRILDLPRLGCLNIHASLLPRWRGAAPIQRAILAGDTETGITIMQMDAGLDTGAIRLAGTLSIAATDTAQTLHDRLAALGGQLIVEALRDLPPAVAQDSALATYAAKITKAEAQIDWARSAADIDRAVRAYNPVPGAFTSWQGQPLKIWRAAPLDVTAKQVPGTVMQVSTDTLCVATGRGGLQLLEIQRAGGKRMDVRTFLAGAAIAAGERLGD